MGLMASNAAGCILSDTESMNDLIQQTRKLRSDLHSEWKIGQFDESITDRVYILLGRIKLTTKIKTENDIYEWLEDAKVARDIYGNWVRYRDKLEMAIIQIGHHISKETWNDYPRRGEFI